MRGPRILPRLQQRVDVEPPGRLVWEVWKTPRDVRFRLPVRDAGQHERVRMVLDVVHEVTCGRLDVNAGDASAPLERIRPELLQTGDDAARLHSHPVIGRAPAETLQRERHLHRNARLPVQHSRQSPPLTLQARRRLGHVPADLVHALADQFAQVRRVEHRARRPAACVVHDHPPSLQS